MKRIDSRWRPYGIMAALSALITLFTLYYACGDGPLRDALFASYFKSPLLLFMNFLPVFLIQAIFSLSNLCGLLVIRHLQLCPTVEG